MVAWFIPMLVSFAISVITYLIMPKPKAAKPQAAKDMESPTSEAGRELPVPFGTVLIKSPNALDSSEKNIRTYEVKP